MPDFDFTQPATMPRDRLALVDYIHGTAELQETNYLEWKCGYDLSKRTDAAKVAKHLIGFANRTVAAAARHLGGHAYLVLGVEPGSYAAVEEWDTANIQDWLERYVETELAYQPHYVIADGNRVLVFDIYPPKPGYPIFALQRASEDENGKTMPEATIYVRRLGKTEVASASEFKALQVRLQAGGDTTGPTLALALQADDNGVRVLPRELLTAEHCDEVLSSFYKEAVAALPSTNYFPLVYDDLRSPEEFRQQLDTFITQAKAKWWEVMAYECAKAEPSWLKLTIVNDTDENFEDVQFEVRAPLPRRAIHTSAQNALATLQAPQPPTDWGKYTAAARIRQSASPAVLNPRVGIRAETPDVTLLTFASQHIRPHTPVELPPLLLTLNPSYEAQTVAVAWRVTARNTKGHLPGEFSIQIGPAQGPEASVQATSS